MINYKIKNEKILNIVLNIKTNCMPLPPNSPIVWEKFHDKPHVAVWRSNKIPWDKLELYEEPTKIFIIKDYKETINLINKFSQKKCEILEIEENYLIFRPKRIFNIKKFDIECNTKSAKVLLHYEGGYGDFFNGLRYLKLYPKVTWICEARPSLFNFSRECGLFEDCIIKGQNFDCSYHVSLDDLAKKHKFVSADYPFIQIKPANIQSGIAFCYKGNKVKKTKRREFDVNLLKHLSYSNIMYNLQYDEPPIYWAKNLLINDWLDTAKIISACSYVVSPSTAVAHLAGGLGKETYVVISNDCTKYETSYFPNRSNLFYKKSKVIHEEYLGKLR